MDLLTIEKYLEEREEIDFYSARDNSEPDTEDIDFDFMEIDGFSTLLD